MADTAAEEQGKIRFVGIVIDVQNGSYEPDEEMVTTAKLIEEEQGTTYPCIMLCKDFEPLMEQLSAVPCYLIVDKNGEPVTGLVIAAREQSKWEEAFNALLAE